MTTTVPALTARMGNRDYYITKMSAFELSGQVSVASELQDWEELTLEELYQRDLNSKRVMEDIAPYLVNSPGRFFGSIIVWILDPTALTFEPVSRHIEVLAAYAGAAESMGFLVLNANNGGNGRLVALDGQHRLAALRAVVQGEVNGPFQNAVTNDEVAVIFVKDKNVRDARDLFTVLNRSARKVSRSDVLIMGEVDGGAIVARRLTGRSLLAPRGLDHDPLVKWDSNTIARSDRRLTTLNALYEMCGYVAAVLGLDLQSGEETGTPPPPDVLRRVEDEAYRWLGLFFAVFEALEEMRHDPELIAEGRRNGEPYSLLLKPVGLGIFFGAVAAVIRFGGLTQSEAERVIKALSRLSWSLDDPLWAGVVVNQNGTVTNRKASISLAIDLAAWVCGAGEFTADVEASLLERYRRQLGDASLSLPKRLVG